MIPTELIKQYNFRTLNDAYVSCKEIANKYGGQMICKNGLPGVTISEVTLLTSRTRTEGVFKFIVCPLKDWRDYRLTNTQRESFELNLKQSNFDRLCSMQ